MSTWGALARSTAALSRAGGRAVAGGLENAVSQRGRRAVRTGMLAPGDPSPPPGAGDHYDYRGLTPPRKLGHLSQGPYRLGAAVDLRSGRRPAVGLTDEVLARHAAVVGPSGVGKTTSLLIPWALSAVRQGHSVAMVDVAGDLVEQIQDAAARDGGLGGRLARWDLSNPAASLSWNWLAEIDSHEAVAGAVEALCGRERANDPQPYFTQRERRLLGGLILCALEGISQPTGRDLVRLSRNQNLLRSLVHATPRHAGRLDEAVLAEPWEFGKIMSGIVNVLDVFEHPGLHAVTAVDHLRLSHLFDEPSLLVVGAPLHASRPAVAASALMLNLLARELYRGFGQTRRRLFLIADEARRYLDRVDFEELSSVSRRAGVSLVLGLQGVEQIPEESQRHAILGNCATYVAFPTPSEMSARYLASRLGERRQTAQTQSVQMAGFGHGTSRQWTRSIEATPVLGLREIMDQPFGGIPALVHAPQIAAAPFVVDLTIR